MKKFVTLLLCMLPVSLFAQVNEMGFVRQWIIMIMKQ